ncbi:ribonuclease H-like protein [Dendrothele bispora CBS 962.96]|uniref:Ribonuclease H-like protein n=1 Tax=Dendrothele bispora (strain CBS 962.96) TaxID=1314807 RepID=A0A4S8MYD7_DENBC|nr:ribonuclease H-like protein [Dendrothele bispora CBS 962.96]
MFSSLGLFRKQACPEDNCTRTTCLFAHGIQPVDPLIIPEPKVVPAKRSAGVSQTSSSLPSTSSPKEPPRKLQKVAHSQTKPTETSSRTGVPVLTIKPALSTVAIPVRQAMLKTVYDHYVVLYDQLLPQHPHLAHDHALKHEEQVYHNSNKFTYRNAVIQSVAAIKRRPIPTSYTHPSVGTEADLAARVQAKNDIAAFRLSTPALEPYVLSVPDLDKWGYITAIPDSLGGRQPSMSGSIVKCERCPEMFMVSSEFDPVACLHHWGKPYTRVVNGERVRTYNCCSKHVSEDGCVRGPHVFYESNPDILHARHPFSFLTSPSQPRSTLDIAALDCEMVYTTGGMRVARVSVVDGNGKSVFDEFVRMDDGVDVLDFNTRFSGITASDYASKAHLPLASIRKSLDALMDTHTILIGHALENDLKTLRIIHHRCIDTAILFPHPAGAPYRRSLRDLARDHLQTKIQTGDGSTGHSSLEDAVATLDLVKFFTMNKGKLSGSIPSTSVGSRSNATSKRVPSTGSAGTLRTPAGAGSPSATASRTGTPSTSSSSRSPSVSVYVK